MEANSPSGFDYRGRPQYGPGLLAKLFGGADPLQGGIYSPIDARNAGRQALLRAGLSILQNSGPSLRPRGLGEILATGILEGQNAYESGVGNTLAQRQYQAQQAEAERLGSLRREFAARFGGGPVTQEMLQALVVRAAQGDAEAARMVPALADMLKVQQQDNYRAPIRDAEAVDARGNPVTRYLDPVTLEPLREYPRYERPREIPYGYTPEGIKRFRERSAPRQTAAERQRLQGLNELINLSNDIIGDDGQSGLLAQDPQGVGLGRMLPDWANTRLDQGGIPLRSTISNLKTTIRNLRSGQAVTESEARELEGMLPDRSDAPAAVRQKVATLLVHLRRLLAAMQTPVPSVVPAPEVEF